MKNIAIGVLVFLGVSVGLQRGAFAFAVFGVSGHVCRGYTSADDGRLKYDSQFGLYNDNGSAAALVACVIPFDNAQLIGTVRVDFYDRNANDHLNCTLTIVDNTGLAIYDKNRVSQGASSAPQFFDWTFTPLTSGNAVLIRCSIPAKVSTGGQRSHITWMGVTTDSP